MRLGRLRQGSRAASVFAALLMVIIRGAQAPAVALGRHDDAPVIDPLGERAAVVFSADLADDRVPSVRLSALRCTSASRTQWLRGYLAAAAETHGENLAA